MVNHWPYTPGELARTCLVNLNAIDGAEDQPEAQLFAADFVIACLRLMAKWPQEARPGFVATLPFSPPEMIELGERDVFNDANKRRLAIARLGTWARVGYYLADGVVASCGDFLRQLQPHLDSYDDRVAAGILAEDMDRRAMDAVG